MLRGGDYSHHQEDLDVSRVPEDFIVARTAQVKGGKYGTTIDRAYAQHKANARKGGKLFSSYVYLGSGLSAEGNVAVHAGVEPDRAVPLMLDWEDGSGNAAFLHTCYGAFTNAGYHVWGLYAPRWYWQAQGSQSLASPAPLVSSRYADNAPGDWESEYRSTPESYWLGYGDNTVRMLQFSSVVRNQPYPTRDTDGLAFKGSRDALADWWDASTPNPPVNPADLRGVELVERITLPVAMTTRTERISLPGGPGARIVIRPAGISQALGNKTPDPVFMGDIFAWGDNNVGVGHNPVFAPGYNNRWDTVREWALPGALWADISYSCKNPVVIDILG